MRAGDRYRKCLATILIAAALAVPADAQVQHGPGYSKGPVPVSSQFITGWKQLRTGMTGQQVGSMIGTDWHHRFYSQGFQYGETLLIPPTNRFSWWRTDRTKGFERQLWFEVEFRYDPASRQWGAFNKRVDWHTDKYFEGSGVYDHFDVSDEFR